MGKHLVRTQRALRPLKKYDSPISEHQASSRQRQEPLTKIQVGGPSAPLARQSAAWRFAMHPAAPKQCAIRPSNHQGRLPFLSAPIERAGRCCAPQVAPGCCPARQGVLCDCECNWPDLCRYGSRALWALVRLLRHPAKNKSRSFVPPFSRIFGSMPSPCKQRRRPKPTAKPSNQGPAQALLWKKRHASPLLRLCSAVGASR